MSADTRDPRSIVTPEAFEIDAALLGTPLARPSRRLFALLIDLALVGLLTAVLSSFTLLVWGAIALVLIRTALQRSQRAQRSMGQAGALLLRSSAGCLGTLILVIVLGVWATGQMDEEQRESALEGVLERGTGLVGPELRLEMADVLDYDDVDTPDEALRVMAEGARRMRDVPLALRRQLLRTSVPPGAPWAAQSDSLVELALSGAVPAADSAADSLSGARPVAEMSDAEALRALAEEAESPSGDAERLRALRGRAAGLVASDTLAALGERIDDVEEELEAEREARQDLEEELGQSRTGLAAFAGLLGEVWGEVGSAIGVWSFYFTVLLTLGKGQTIGKRLMRVRVLRLDGLPIGWWSAFERAGGYVAGLATGFLGFAQILWDPNRQCIHDKIVGTVVVAEGEARVPGDWEGEWRRRTKS